MECFEETEPEPWSSCLSVSEGSTSHDLVYHLHGRRGAATWWNDQDYYSARVHRAWRDANVEPPAVATVSFGPLWFLTENGSDAQGQRMRTFLEHVVPTIEGRLGYKVNRRLAVGESMGGVNALLLATKAGEAFDRVAALCPPLYTTSPYAGVGELWKVADSSGISTERAVMLMSLGRYMYPAERAWELDDPLQAVLRGRARALPPIYLSCGARDGWGCMNGSLAFVDAVRAVGGRVEWHQRPGGHCDIDTESLAAFLARE